jgi:hypothetical protein
VRKSSLKGTVARDGYFDHSIVSRLESKDLKFFSFFVELFGAAFSVFGRVRQYFLTTYEDSIGSIFQPWDTGYYIRAPREQNAIKVFSLCTGIYHSDAYSLYGLTPNEFNLALTFFLSWIGCKERKKHLTLLSL